MRTRLAVPRACDREGSVGAGHLRSRAHEGDEGEGASMRSKHEVRPLPQRPRRVEVVLRADELDASSFQGIRVVGGFEGGHCFSREVIELLKEICERHDSSQSLVCQHR